MPSAALAPAPKYTRTLGNEVARIRLPAQVLAEMVSSPLETACWIDSPHIEARSVLQCLREGKLLAPAPGEMGHDLHGQDEHEQRVAWLMDAGPSTWDPIELQTTVLPEGEHPEFNLSDGHHRLAAGVLLNLDLVVDITAGTLSSVDKLVARGGEWLERPEGEVFGEGVFPSLRERQHVRLHGRDSAFGMGQSWWVEDLVTGSCLARFGSRLWTVDPVPEPFIEQHEEAQPQRQHKLREGMGHEPFLASFADACEALIVGDNVAFREALLGNQTAA